MHPNPAFRAEAQARHVAFARDRAFGTLAVNAAQGPLLSHVPFLLNEDANALEAHLVRSNPIVRLLRDEQPAVIAVSGPDGYVSPDWYGVADQVPTWNYVAVHLRGTLRLLDHGEIEGVLERQSADRERRLAPKLPWHHSKMTRDAFERMLRQIVPVAMEIAGIDGTWKASQNKPDDVRLRAASAMAEQPGEAHAAMADLMRSG